MAALRLDLPRSTPLQAQDSPAPVPGYAIQSVPLRHRVVALKAAPSNGARPASVIDAFAKHSPDLVWHTREPVAAQNESTHRQAPDAHTVPATTATPGPQTEIANPQAAHALLRNQPLDPAFVDRVADDVIRRIDRRLRIERERRGL